MKKLSVSNLVNAVILFLMLGIGSWVYSAVEKVETLRTDQAVAEEKQKRLESDVKEVKQDVKELKQDQKSASEEQKSMLKEILDNQKKKQSK